MQKLKVGIIGAGMALERLHYPAFQQLADKYQIVAIADTDEARVKNWAQRLQLPPEKAYSDYRQMLENENLDVIDIMVPIEQNFTVTKDVAARLSRDGKGKGIICEKPLAPSLSQATAARDLSSKYDLPIMIAENYRYNQEMDIIRDLVQQKRVGDTFYFIQNRVLNFPEEMVKNTFFAKEWRQHPQFSGGAFMDVAIHDLAGLRHIFGPIDKVQAFARPEPLEFSPYSVINANLRFASGITGQFTFFCAGKEMQRPLIGLRIFGTEGMIYLEERDAGVINLSFNDGRSEQIPYQPQQGYYNELLNFYNALTGAEPVSVTPEVEFGDVKTVEAILRSIREERIMKVDKQPEYQPQLERPGEQPRVPLQ